MLTATDLLRDLVRIPSLNPMGRSWVSGDLLYEHRLTAYLESFITSLGLETTRQTVLPQRDNLIAYYRNPKVSRTILFEVHQDTVPVEGMIVDPFGGEIRDGKLYGRGSCDVKGSMAAMLTVLGRLTKEKPPNSANLIVAFTVDEEHTFLGVQYLQQRLKEGPKVDLAIVAEPTQLDIVDAHKGVVRWKVETKGKACHSSTPDQGINAIYRMGKSLTVIEEYANYLSQSKQNPQFGPATISVGRIEGGASVNTVPDSCVIEIDRRLLPGEKPDDAYQDFQIYLRAKGIEEFVCHPIWLSCPALSATHSGELKQRLGREIDQVKGNHRVFQVPFGTDASTIAELGIPTVVFGPGDIAQAHTSDEWIELAQVDQAAEILYRLVCQS